MLFRIYGHVKKLLYFLDFERSESVNTNNTLLSLKCVFNKIKLHITIRLLFIDYLNVYHHKKQLIIIDKKKSKIVRVFRIT